MWGCEIKIKKKICVWFFTTSDKINFLGVKNLKILKAYGTVRVNGKLNFGF